MRKIKVVVLLVRQLQHGFTKNAKVSPNLTVTHMPFNDAMSHLLIVKRLELYMDLALYKINILLLLLYAYLTIIEPAIYVCMYRMC